MDGFDVVAVGVQHEGAVVPGMIVPLAGPAIVAAARCQRRRVEPMDSLSSGYNDVMLDRSTGAARRAFPPERPALRPSVGAAIRTRTFRATGDGSWRSRLKY